MAILINGPCLSRNYIAAICLVQTLTWDLSCLTFHWLTLVIAILNFLKLFSFKKTFNNFFSMFSKICPMSVSSNDCFFPYLERLFLSLFGTIVSFLIWNDCFFPYLENTSRNVLFFSDQYQLQIFQNNPEQILLLGWNTSWGLSCTSYKAVHLKIVI